MIGWTLAFKAVSGDGSNVFDAYNSGGTLSEFDEDNLDVTKKRDHHYKNRIVLNWAQFNPSEVKQYRCGILMKTINWHV